MKDLISIITPVYNVEKYIEETIVSVMKQTYRNWELIIVNDLSTDKTEEKIKAYQDDRIKLISLKENIGPAKARNFAIQEARGKYIAFIDGDDLWLENKLELQLEFMKKNEYDFTFGSYYICSENGTILSEPVKVFDKIDYEILLNRGNQIGTLSVMINKDTVDIKMPNFSNEDYATWLSITKTGILAHGINEPLGIYRKRRGSLSNNKFKCAKYNYYIYKDYLKLDKKTRYKSWFKYCIYSIYKYIKIAINRYIPRKKAYKTIKRKNG